MMGEPVEESEDEDEVEHKSFKCSNILENIS